MEKQTERIKRFSEMISVLLTVASIVLIVVLAAEVFAWLLTSAHLPTETISVNGVDREATVLFKLGSTNVILPFIWKAGFTYAGIPMLQGVFSVVGIGDIIGAVFALVAVRSARAVFRLLRGNGSPFREEMAKPTRRLAAILLLMGCVSGIVPFIAAGIVGVFCLIFDYGRMLQNENDTTL